MDVVHRTNDIDFVWDFRKAAANLQRHGVSLETACEIFFDPFVRFLRSEVVEGEPRETIVGLTAGWKLLVVIFTPREDSIRLISARYASRQERSHYEDEPAP
ncbi:MAG TPA: BrnT family toxin [Thermoanaerobaculia bacterium]